jgi:hypothetical protein
LSADLIGSRVLPDDGIAVGPAGFSIPDHRGFALIGDADCGDVFRAQTGFSHGAGGRIRGVSPNFHGIVLHPAGPRIDLLVLKLAGGDGFAGVIEDHAPAACGPLV